MSMNTPAPRKRLDIWLTESGKARSRSAAADLIKRGKVLVDGAPAAKAGQLVRGDEIEVTETGGYVGRGGLKLAGALDVFGVDLNGKVVADIGSSTGGFTECALRRGAARVFAIDVGTDQLAPALRADPRVTVMEQTDVRSISSLPEPADAAVIDVSFISVTRILPRLAALTTPEARAVVLVKPQFESGSSLKAAKGIVKDPEERRKAIEKAKAAAVESGWEVLAETPSPIAGGDGNIEHFLHIAKIRPLCYK